MQSGEDGPGLALERLGLSTGCCRSKGISLPHTASFTLFPLGSSPGCVGHSQAAVTVRRRKWPSLASGPQLGTLELLNIPLISPFPSRLLPGQGLLTTHLGAYQYPKATQPLPAASALPLSPTAPSRGSPPFSAGLPTWASSPPVPITGPSVPDPSLPPDTWDACLCLRAASPESRLLPVAPVGALLPRRPYPPLTPPSVI